MLPAVGDFLKSTFGESLKKPLQPAGVFAAGIFLLLHALFIFPTLVDQNQPMAVAIRDMGAVAQAVFAAVIVLVASYVLLSMSSSILKLMSGESWQSAPGFGGRFADWQATRRRELRRDLWNARADSTELRAYRRERMFRLSRDYPPANTRVAPTALGNVLQATSAYLWDRYRIDMTTLWPHMETIIADDKALASRIDDEKATLDFLLNLEFVLFVFAFENAALRFSLHQWPEAMWSLGFLIAGLGIYSAAVSKARSWGGAVQLAFDLHRDKLRESFGLRPFTGPSDEREVWRRVSRWLLWGEPLDDHLLAGSGHANGLILTHADNINVQVVSGERIQDITFQDGLPRSRVHWEKMLDYVLLVSAPNNGAQAYTDIHVLVSDPRVPLRNPHRELASEPIQPADQTGWSWRAAPAAEPAGAPTFLWTHASVPANSTSLLQYSLPIARADVYSDINWLTIGAGSRITPGKGMIALDCTFDLRLNGALRPQPPGQLRVVDSRVGLPETALVLPGRITTKGSDRAERVCADAPPATAGCERTYLFNIDWPTQQTPPPTRTLRCLLLARPEQDISDRLRQILVHLSLWPFLHLDAPSERDQDWDELVRDTGSPARALVNWDNLNGRDDAPLNVWAWVLMELSDLAARVRDPRVLNNLGCAWMWFAEWDLAERTLREAVSPQLRDNRADDPTWREGDEAPRSAKEAADQNLYQLSRARDAWMRGY